MTGTQSEFAKHIGRTKQYVSKLKSQGKLVLEGGKVHFEKTLAVLAATADPSHDPSHSIPRKDGRTEKSVGMQAAETTGNKTQGVAEQYQSSRAVREAYNARMAKLEYEQMAGELVHRDGVTMASFKIGRILRDKLQSIPARLAPLLTLETEQKEVYAILDKEVQAIIQQMQQALAESRA